MTLSRLFQMVSADNEINWGEICDHEYVSGRTGNRDWKATVLRRLLPPGRTRHYRISRSFRGT